MKSGSSVDRREFMSAAVGTAAAVGYVDTGDAAIDPELETRSGRVQGVVRLENEPVDPTDERSRETVLTGLKEHAATTQQHVVDYVEETPGIAVRRQFWLANTVLVSVDTDRASFGDLAALDGVDRIHRTGTGSRTRSVKRDRTHAAVSQTGQERDLSYGLEMMNVPDVWERFDTRGSGATVAIIDTGVGASHPDIDLDGWAEFDAEGKRVDSEPHDPDGHGTGMSSLAVGGDASGTQIGVAPEADLLVAKHDTEDFFTSSWAALEWAVENGADAVSMSFDIGPLKHEAIEAVTNARAAGTVVVSAGFGPGFFLSPGAISSVLIS